MNIHLFLYWAYRTRKWHDAMALGVLCIVFTVGLVWMKELPSIFFGIAFVLFVVVGMAMGASVAIIAYVKHAIAETAEEDGMSPEVLEVEFLIDMWDEGNETRLAKKAARAAKREEKRKLTWGA